MKEGKGGGSDPTARGNGGRPLPPFPLAVGSLAQIVPPGKGPEREKIKKNYNQVPTARRNGGRDPTAISPGGRGIEVQLFGMAA